MISHDVMIQLKTAADPKGAVDTEKSLDRVGDAGKKAGEKTKSGAQVAENSIEALEQELQTLQGELNRVEVGSAQFNTLAQKVSATTGKLDLAEQAARKLGATTGRGGNSGMAMLEFSRLAEDAQYGLRGILNNVPTLIMQLGGTAGLAGVISVVAVAASQLWERFGGGTKAAGDDVDALIEKAKALKDFWDGIAQKNIDINAKDAANDARDLNSEIGRIGQNLKLGLDKQSLESVRIEAEKRLEVSKRSLKLAELEAEAARGGNVTALQLAQARLGVAKDMLQIEYDAAELKRKDAEVQSRKKLTAATLEASAAVPANDQRINEVVEIENAIAGAEERLKESQQYRLQQLAAAKKELEDAEKVAALTAGTDGELISSGLVVRAEQRVKDLSKPGDEEEKWDQQIKSLTTESLPAAQEALRVSADGLQKLNDIVAQAESTFRTLVESNGIQRNAEKDILAIDNKQADMKATDDFKSLTIDGVRSIIEQAEAKGGASKELQAVLEEAKRAINDGVLSAADLERLPVILSSFSAQLQNLGIFVQKIEEANRMLEDYGRRIKALEINKK